MIIKTTEVLGRNLVRRSHLRFPSAVRRWSVTTRAILAVGIVAILAPSAGLVSAAVPSPNGVIHACYKADDAVKEGGAFLKIIDAEAGAQCKGDQIEMTFKDAASFDALAAALRAVDTTLQSNIDAETAARAAADTTLQSNIDTEASARQSADTTLQGNITSEATARVNGDAATLSAAKTYTDSKVPSGANFATSNQSCPVGNLFAIGINSSGALVCAIPGKGSLSMVEVQGPVGTMCSVLDPSEGCSTGASSFAACPSQHLVVGGGFSAGGPGVKIEVSRAHGTPQPFGWIAAAVNSSLGSGGSIRAFAMCLRLS